MLTTGYVLTWIVAVGIVIVGLRFLLVPEASAAGYGIAVQRAASVRAYLSVKAVRDIASGIFLAILLTHHDARLLAWFVLAATLIPIADAAIVLTHGGSRTAAFGIHGATAVLMLVAVFLLFIR